MMFKVDECEGCDVEGRKMREICANERRKDLDKIEKISLNVSEEKEKLYNKKYLRSYSHICQLVKLSQ